MAIGAETYITGSILLYYIVASAVAYFRRKTPSPPPANGTTEAEVKAEPPPPRLRKSILAASIFTIFISIAVSVVQGAQLAEHRQGGIHKRVDDLLFADLLFLVSWIILSLGLLHSNGKITYPHIGSWILSLLIRAILKFDDLYHTHYDSETLKRLHVIALASQVATVFLTIVIGVLQKSLSSLPLRDQSPESQPLLAEQSESTSTKKDGTDKAVEKEETEDDKARKEIRDRPLRKYVTSFKIFVPFMLPSSTRQRLYFAGMCACSLAARVINILKPLTLGQVINQLGRSNIPWGPIFTFLLLYLFSSSIGISFLEQILYLRLSQEQTLALNRASYSHIMDLSQDFQDSKSSASVWQSLYQARSVIALFHDIGFEVAPAVIDLVSGFVVLSSVFGGYMALLLMTTVVSFIWLTLDALPPKAELQRKYRDAYIAEFYQMVNSSQNWQTCTHNGQIQHEKQEFRDKGQACQDAFFVSTNYGYWTRSVRVFFHILAFFCACCLAAVEISNGEQKIGAFVILTSYWAQLTSPLTQIVEEINRTVSKLVDAEKLLVLLEKKPTIYDEPDAEEYQYLGGAIDFENVHFSYDGKRNAAEGSTFRSIAGTTTAFVGQTGSGKSTLLKLLFRLYDPEKGRVCIDGQDLKKLQLETFRRHVAVVPQDPALFNTTVLDNVRYPNLSLSQEEVEAACKAVALHDKIMTFKKGYMEKCGERGCRLSGGELQRMAIARAILKKPDILLLDEATSSVDSVTEAHIQKSLDELCKGKTTFVIAHRLSTILKADQILVIEEGKIVEGGTHGELLEKKGVYHKLWTTQLKLQSEVEKEVEAVTKKEAMTLVNDLSETQEESTRLTKVVSEGDADKNDTENAAPEPETEEATAQSAHEVAEWREQLENSPDTKPKRGRDRGQTVKDRIKSINRRLSVSRSPKRTEASGQSANESAMGSSLKANAPEFVPRSLDGSQHDGVAELGPGVTVRAKKTNTSSRELNGDGRRAQSEPNGRDRGTETEEGETTEDDEEVDARYSRIPKRSR